MPGIRKRSGKMAAFRSKIANAETTRERRQVQQNPAGALKFHGNRFTDAGMLTAPQICGDSISVFIELLEYRQTPPATKRAARCVPDSHLRRWDAALFIKTESEREGRVGGADGAAIRWASVELHSFTLALRERLFETVDKPRALLIEACL